jgi:AcrR family transcriptional regulator
MVALVTAPAPLPARQRLPAYERRGMITRAALQEFARAGYDAASMGRIAAAAGVGRSVLYDHFPSKQALFEAVLAATAARLLEHLRTTITAAAPMRERMAATFDAYLAFAQGEHDAFSLLYPDHPPVDPAVAASHRRLRSETNRLLAELLAPDARRAGIEPDSRVGQIVYALHQAALREAVRWWDSHPDVERSELVAGLMAALWDGLGGRARRG